MGVIKTRYYTLYNDIPGFLSKKNPSWHLKVYNMWKDMWKRVYTNMNYFGSLIYPKFDHLSEYVAFIESQSNFEEFISTCNDVSWSVDKDMKVRDNRNYYPEFMSLVTKSENDKERIARKGSPNKDNFKSIIGIHKKDGSTITLKSINEAREYGFTSPGNIISCAKGRIPSYKGYIWKYLDKE